MISLVVFLGNHGPTYAGNRHNVAWIFAQNLSWSQELSWQRKFRGQYASRRFTGPDGALRPVHFLKPETFMNLSGESVQEALRFFRLTPEEVLIVHDELELSPGTVSLKWSGGLGGHNGLRSLKASLGTADFWRLRFGIGRPSHADIASYVLSDFSPDERIMLAQLQRPVEALLNQILEDDPKRALPEWAKKKLLDEGV